MTNQNMNTELNNDVKEDLHIPHVSILQWYGVGEIVKVSSQDKTVRSISVRFYLEDLRAGTSHTYLVLNEDMSQNTYNQHGTVSVRFEKNKEGYFQSILVELLSNGCIEAFKEASKFVHGILSTLCFFYRRSFRIGIITAYDISHRAEFTTRKIFPKPEILIKPLASFKPGPIGSLFAIYREGINSVDLAYRYICFFKIYEAWNKHWKSFFSKNDKKKQKILITKELLAGSYRQNHHQEFLNKTFNNGDVYKALNHIRKYLVHPVIDDGIPASFYNLDQIDTIEAIESFSNLMERIATKILVIELNLLSEKDYDTKVLLETFKVIK